MLQETELRERLKQVFDPELGINVVDLGLIYNIDVNGRDVDVTMTLTTPGCPMHDTIAGGVERVLKETPGIEKVNVQVVWEPRWNPEMMSEEAKEHLGFF